MEGGIDVFLDNDAVADFVVDVAIMLFLLLLLLSLLLLLLLLLVVAAHVFVVPVFDVAFATNSWMG